MNSTQRINDFSLMVFDETLDTINFWKVQSELPLVNPQYFIDYDLNNIVWDLGSLKYQHTLNKIFSGLPLFTPIEGVTISLPKLVTDVHLKIGQGFSWDNLFGLHVIIKSSKTNEILISKIIKLSDFQIGNEIMIDGMLWGEEVILKIPTTSDILVTQVTKIQNSEITSTGVLLNYPYDFVILLDEKPLPDYIQNNISFDDNHYLNINLISTENKTVEQTLIDEFNVIASQIKVSHIINYGNSNIAFKTIRISDEDNKFDTINIGLNLLPYFIDPIVNGILDTTINNLVTIFVSTEIIVNGTLLTRQSSIVTDLGTINPFIATQIIKTNEQMTNYPVTVTQQNVVTNTIIEAKQTTKIISIYQPVFMEIIKDDIIFESKNIYFNKITKPCYLVIIATSTDSEQIIFSQITSDNKYYFDLSQLVPIVSPTTYDIVMADTLIIIGKGNVLLS
jgi:hypothetical protein